ncbi:kinesin-like protein KIF13B isoform X3 [Hermetia illucens]|uniref:kinesin-like protein KIF13B isoform X3 n=1 Tax=Hermetia illucens TaxID=343691 RepID=UPI0018CC7AE4|nr:kinesin-like protein KIF13B isoform X3 [Hermetia illucens]
MSTDKIKVAVRVRPFNRRELELGTQGIIEMDACQTIIYNPTCLEKNERKQRKIFAFDHCFYSSDPDAEHFATQENVFNSIGRDILENAFQGYNACIFAYGQTGSGKSYTMMGTQESKGIIPRLCDELFALITTRETSSLLCKVEVSYMEIYNEKVHDLLDPKPNKHSLKVREHNVLGPYVDGLSQLAVTCYEDVDKLMTEGNKSRTVAATNMNAESSRSHAVFSLILTQTLTDEQSGVTGEKVARISLVDLAGSERAIKTGTVGDRLKEGSNINKSLTTLGLVISKLADQSSGKNRNDKFVPYRDSVLTWLLKDNLGGNSKTVMLATISPSADNYEETLSTLRYADRAKRIVNHAVVNEDPNARIIRELRLEVENLRNMLKHATESYSGDTQRFDIHDKLTESEKLMKQISQTWEEKLEKTEQIQSERQQALEKMGISIQASGIKVEKDKYYLVNLNADPSLNELLVYYLKDRTLVGGQNVEEEPDIQLFGLGIQPKHCYITIEGGDLYMEPLPNARCFINGSPIQDKTILNHGDRILWGNHHFFRVNCPKSTNNFNLSSEPQTPAPQIDYNFARDEIMQNELSNDPIQAAISKLERQHEEDKQVALERQRQEYERQFQQLRNILSPTTPYAPYIPYDPLRVGKHTPCTPTSQMKVEKWAQERDEMFKRSLKQLKTDIMRANSFVKEANFLAEEMGKQTKFSVTLQIPPANLSPNRKRGAFVSEPAILVKRMNSGSQIWSMEKLENKLIDMREIYQEYKEKSIHDLEDEPRKYVDPFYESQENHNLIGVANIFLEVLFHDVKLDYQTPIISQQGEVAGRLQVEISRVNGQLYQDRLCESISECSSDSRDDEFDRNDPASNQITCRVNIKQATGLPLSLSNFVFCQYTFWGHQETVVPVIQSEAPGHNQNLTFKFDHVKDYTANISEEFLEHCAEGALSVEVWGHRSAGFSKTKGWEVEQQQAKARSLVDRWAELSRKIELWVEIHELNDNGDYVPVEVSNRNEVLTGGVYQLRQGQQRRIQVRVKPVQNSGTLPIICQSIVNISVGSVTTRSHLQKPLDSYQEEDLTILREKWSEALGRRRKYLDEQIQKLINKEDKTDEERERELSLVHQWVSLTEERNAVLVPAPGCGIPGAPASWDPPPGMEPHVPVLFLDLNADDLSAQNSNDELPLAGLHSILPKEHGNKFYQLQILQHLDKDICAIAGWDSSLHENQKLNCVTEANERVYLILKTTVRLSHPALMDLVLRKRITLNIYKRQSITEKLKKLRLVRGDNAIYQTGVTYEVVSNIPKASEELEDRESLAQLAASASEIFNGDGETYIEKYTRSVSAVESILTLDRLRQSVAVKELERSQTQTLSMRKTVSVPNFSQPKVSCSAWYHWFRTQPTETEPTENYETQDPSDHHLTSTLNPSFQRSNNSYLPESIMRFDTSMESLTNVGRSESFMDLNNSDYGLNQISSWQQTTPTQKAQRNIRDHPVRSRHYFASKSNCDDSPGKPFGIARPTFLNLTPNLNSIKTPQSLKPSPACSKLIGTRMTTLHEEPLVHRPLPEEPEDSYSDPECSDYGVEKTPNEKPKLRMSVSKTMDSLVEVSQLNDNMFNHSSGRSTLRHVTSLGTPSMNSSTSSGYDSQAASTGNLSNDDSSSIRSLNTDGTPEFDSIPSESPPNTKCTNIETATATNSSVNVPPNQQRFNPFLKDSLYIKRKSIDTPEVCQNKKENSTIPKDQPSTHPRPAQGNTSGCAGQTNVAKKDKNKNITDENKSDCRQSLSRSTDMSDKNKNAIVNNRKVDSNCNASESPQILKSDHNQLEDNTTTERMRSAKSEVAPDYAKAESEIAPEWVAVGESVLIRPYNWSGVICFVGPTHFQSGLWVGVELDTPTGRNDGTVQGIQYFICKPRHGIFVRHDKLILDKRGKAMRALKTEKVAKSK